MVTEKIHKHYYVLTAAERKVADFILSAPNKVINMTVNTLSCETKVAPSAVIRFCKAVGFGGFSEFKIALVQDSASAKEEGVLPAFEQGAEVKTTVHKVFKTGIKALRDTESIIDFKKIEKMTVALRKAKRIFIFAVGTSSIVATDFQYRLSQLGFWATAYTDVLFMNVTAVNLTPDDVVLAISHSGRTKAVVDAVRHAKKAGAMAIAVTSFSDSMLYRDSDIAASVFADEINYPVEAVSARLAHICFLDAVTMALATGIEEFPSRIKARNKILNEIRY